MKDDLSNINAAEGVQFKADINITPKSGSYFEPKQIYISLPITADQLRSNLEAVGVSDPRMFNIYSNAASCSLNSLIDHLPDRGMDDKTLNEINYLAAKLQELAPTQLRIFEAILQKEADVNSKIADFINMVENIDHYQLEPIDNDEELGEYRIENLDLSIIDKLGTSDNPAEQYVAKIFSIFVDYVNYDAFGQTVSAEEEGVFTKHGYLPQNSDQLKAVYCELEDMPKAYRILPIETPLVLVENVELTSFLLQMQALAGISMHGIDTSIKTLLQDETHYLMLMTGSDMFIAPFKDAYYQNSEAYTVWNNWPEHTNTIAFELVVRYRDSGVVLGNLQELNVREQLNNILLNSINPSYVEAVTTDGQKLTFANEEWNSMPVEERFKLHRWQPVHNPDPATLGFLAAHLDVIHSQDNSNHIILSPQEFLAKINFSYMQQSKFQLPDMLRIPHQMATELLVRDSTQVYQMKQGGLTELSRMDALKLNSNAVGKYVEFAVRPDAMGEIEKWAKRQLETICQKSEKGLTALKDKNKHDEER